MEKEISINVKELCHHIGHSLPTGELKRIYRDVLGKMIRILDSSSESFHSFNEFDESHLCKKVEKQICHLSREDKIISFNNLYRKLKKTESLSLFKSGSSFIYFLLKISEARHGNSNSLLLESSLQSTGKHLSLLQHSGAGDGVANHSSDGEIVNVRPSSLDENHLKKGNTCSINISHDFSKKRCGYMMLEANCRRSSDSLSLLSVSPRYIKGSKFHASERTVLDELMYCFQGVGGNVLKLDLHQGFIIDPQVRIQHSSVVERLIELGYLHNRVVSACNDLQKNGCVAQAVETGIRKQLTNYYGLIGCMHSELSQCIDSNDDTPLQEECLESGTRVTLRKLLIWTNEPLKTMRTLCDALNGIHNKRGGGILNCLDRLRHHGDPIYQSVIQTLFDYAGKPFMSMIRNWILEGELYDQYDEFFITINSGCKDCDIWRDKFILRTSMIPNVVSHKLADTILRAGKAIHFLNVICEQRVPVLGMRQKLHHLKESNLLDLTNTRSELSITVNGILEETSKLVLETLVNKFKLFQHFQGLRRYILLGQGDFANYFMELIEPEMRKPASALRYIELMGLLGTAIRSTTAAYEDPEIIKRVSVKLLIASGGDWGSDVFGLQYIMQDPLGAAFGLNDGAYSHMFNFLWRTKRMEYILFSLRKKRYAIKNKLSWLEDQISEVKNVLTLVDRLSQELVHFAHQFHYYILFEVVECLWEKFSNALQKATSLDDVINAHNIFIREIQVQTFQDEASRKFINELRLIWDLVFELEALETSFICRVKQEYEDRVEREKRIEKEGTSHEEEVRFEETNKHFIIFLKTVRAKYSIIIKNNQNVLEKFLLELSKRKDYQLRMLSARIDFNEYYRKNGYLLSESMKYNRCISLH